MAPKAGTITSTHDITISDGTTTLGFMLYRPKGKRLFRIDDFQPIQPRVLQEGEITQVTYASPAAIVHYQEDWRKGIGGIWLRKDPLKLADATLIDASVEGILRPARHLNATTVDSNPTEYVPSGFAAMGSQVWAFIGRGLYTWDFTNKNWDASSVPVAATRLFRNGVNFGGNVYAPSWADDVGSGGSYVQVDMPVNYIHKTPSAASWTLVSGAGSTNLDSFKYFAVANNKLWGANCVHWADSTLDNEGVPLIDTVATPNQATSTNSLTFSLTVASQDNRCLLVGIYTYNSGGAPADPTSVTYGGVAMTSILTRTQGVHMLSVWQLIAPTTGTNNVVATWAGSHGVLGAVAWSLYNVHQTTPVTNTGGSTSPSDTERSAAVTSADNEIGIHWIAAGSTSAYVEGAGQTNRASSGGGSQDRYSGVEESTGALVTLSGSWTGASICIINAISVQAPASTSATQTPITITGTPSAQFTAGDVLRTEAEYLLVTTVNDANYASYGHGHIVVIRGYRGTVGATHAYATSLYEGTQYVHHVHSTTDGTTLASWSTATAVGDSSSEITQLLGVAQTDLLVLKTDGIYRLEADGTVTRLTDVTEVRHANQYRNAFVWNTIILLPLHGGGLWAMNGSDYTWHDISFSITMPELTYLHGPVVAMSGVGDSLYAMVLDSTNTKYHILMGKLEQFGGVSDIAWHHMGSITYTTGTDELHAALLVEAITSGANVHHRVLIGAESTGSNLLPYFIPHDGHDADPGFTNSSNAVAVFQKFDGNLPQVEKAWASVDVDIANLGAGGRQWALEHRLDGGSWLTTLTDAAGNADGIVDSTAASQTLTFPNRTTAKVLEIRAKPSLAAVGTTPAEINSIRVTYQIASARIDVLPLTVYLADHQVNRNGSRRGRPKLDLAKLEEWHNAAAEVTVVDPRGTSRQMMFWRGSLKRQELSDEIKQRSEWAVSFLLVQV